MAAVAGHVRRAARAAVAALAREEKPRPSPKAGWLALSVLVACLAVAALAVALRELSPDAHRSSFVSTPDESSAREP